MLINFKIIIIITGISKAFYNNINYFIYLILPGFMIFNNKQITFQWKCVHVCECVFTVVKNTDHKGSILYMYVHILDVYISKIYYGSL